LKALLKKIKKSHKDSHPKRQHACRILIKQARYVLDGLETSQAGRKIRHQQQRTRQMQKTLGKDQDKRATLALIESSGLFPAISRAWRLSN
jgi:CHAD domain-containing protein